MQTVSVSAPRTVTRRQPKKMGGGKKDLNTEVTHRAFIKIKKNQKNFDSFDLL